jgi:DNA-binding Lrp family transcriptional regulator
LQGRWQEDSSVNKEGKKILNRSLSLRKIAKIIQNHFPDKPIPSVTAIKNHIDFLEENEVIKHYIAVVDCCKVGYRDMLIITLRINTSVPIDDIFTELEKIKDINAIYMTSGTYPILCLAKCLSKEHQIGTLENIKRIKGIDEVHTQIVMRRIKEDMRVKIPKIA